MSGDMILLPAPSDLKSRMKTDPPHSDGGYRRKPSQVQSIVCQMYLPPKTRHIMHIS